MKAVVMAGGQGTRLRPLTSNVPKPMVAVGNKPTAEHILDLLHRHGIEHVVMTVAFMSEVIRAHFGDGSALGMSIEYAVEESPLGTAGSVKNAASVLDDTFVIISGDSLTDFDLSTVIDFHRQREAMVTIALKSVDNPLEFGVVIVDEDGRIERFLENRDGARSSPTPSTPASTSWSPRCWTTYQRASPTTSVTNSSQTLRDAQASLRLRPRWLLAGHRQSGAVPAGQP